MFLPASIFTVLLWLGCGAAVICVIVVRVNGFKWQPLAGIAIGLLVGLGPRAMTTHVIVVSDAGGRGIEADQQRMLGSREYRFSDGHTAKLEGKKETIIVNDSHRPLTLKSVYYGTLRLPSSPQQIDPGTVTEVGRDIEHIGPTDRPPGSVSVSKGSSFAIRDWLTW